MVIRKRQKQVLNALTQTLLQRYGYRPDAVDRGFGDLFSGENIDPDVRTLYVHPDLGSDDNDGLTRANPIKNLQTAVWRFKSLAGAPPRWIQGDDRKVIVMKDNDPTITGHVIVPPHFGLGVLRIIAEENLLHEGLVQSGALALQSGKKAVHRLTFTTSPLTANAHKKLAFVRPQNRLAGALDANDPISAGIEDVPILGNDTNYVDVVVSPFFPGSTYGDGNVVDIVSPAVTLDVTSDRLGFYDIPLPMFYNMGGRLSVEGFRPLGDNTGTSPCILWNEGNTAAKGYAYPSAQLNRCLIQDCTGEYVGGRAVGLQGCMAKLSFDRNPPLAANGSKGITLYNFLFDGAVGFPFVFFENVSFAATEGLYFESPGSAASRSALVFEGTDQSLFGYTDLVKFYVKANPGSRVELFEMSINGMRGSAAGNKDAVVSDGAYVKMAGTVIGTDNAGYGARAHSGGQIIVSAEPDVTGDLGDAKSGDEDVVTWETVDGGTPSVDATNHLSRIAKSST